ncbi:MAG TPA: putative toxin-antitoxin system toxin component, PIN family [Noviherbaspirillum sp.]|uniref:putative toxin-antitoxin system toxin component, PIN family n=1 Tax=Noviherbaspirillum sp. TaxID=1926288 RepID=UPI002D3CA07D|nr:putative toxin-antitoxin system toxin component, PIN family [Noviherbaspirillum sp.]HYD95511.1 putative toxin-antitoxin system toxin component, PIN family [Noviherbaspirillum sp.]
MAAIIPTRIVIDTNVCLDLFVFRDARWAALLGALQEGRVQAVTRADCRTEWLKVLEYPHLPLDAESRPRAAAEFDALIACIEPDRLRPRAGVRLPLCSDPDDQKFLELARDADAAVLITKDKALLKLARKTARDGLFRIAPPDKWQAAAQLG